MRVNCPTQVRLMVTAGNTRLLRPDRPATGKICSLTLSSRMMSNPAQKLGVDRLTTPRRLDNPDQTEPGLAAARTPIDTPTKTAKASPAKANSIVAGRRPKSRLIAGCCLRHEERR